MKAVSPTLENRWPVWSDRNDGIVINIVGVFNSLLRMHNHQSLETIPYWSWENLTFFAKCRVSDINRFVLFLSQWYHLYHQWSICITWAAEGKNRGNAAKSLQRGIPVRNFWTDQRQNPAWLWPEYRSQSQTLAKQEPDREKCPTLQGRARQTPARVMPKSGWTREWHERDKSRTTSRFFSNFYYFVLQPDTNLK